MNFLRSTIFFEFFMIFEKFFDIKMIKIKEEVSPHHGDRGPLIVCYVASS